MISHWCLRGRNLAGGEWPEPLGNDQEGVMSWLAGCGGSEGMLGTAVLRLWL
jgi:hypothetical protein